MCLHSAYAFHLASAGLSVGWPLCPMNSIPADLSPSVVVIGFMKSTACPARLLSASFNSLAWLFLKISHSTGEISDFRFLLIRCWDVFCVGVRLWRLGFLLYRFSWDLEVEHCRNVEQSAFCTPKRKMRRTEFIIVSMCSKLKYVNVVFGGVFVLTQWLRVHFNLTALLHGQAKQEAHYT